MLKQADEQQRQTEKKQNIVNKVQKKLMAEKNKQAEE